MPQFSVGEVILNGKYRIEKLLGEGAFGEVYLATHLKLKALRALKVLRKEGEGGAGSTRFDNVYRRFEQESRLGEQLGSHPHIIQVKDFEVLENLMVLALEYAPGGSLQKRLEALREEGKPMPVADSLRIAAETAEGLSALHNLDVVHRDVKPGNILFDKQGHAKLADFGLAQVPHGPTRRDELSMSPPHPGTGGYMSPEQETPPYNVLTPASDIYALGAVLFEMLTGRSQHLQRPGTRPSNLRPDAPAWLDELVMRMLAKDSQERPFDGAEAAKELRQAGVSAVKAVEAEMGSTHVPAGETKKIEASQEPQGAELRDALEAAIKYQEWEEAEGLLKEYEVADPGSRLVKIYRKQVDRGMEPILAERKAAEEKAKLETAERERRAAEEKARLEAEERARKMRQEGDRLWIKLAKGVEMEFVRVPAGKFTMGSNDYDREKPVHEVHLDEYWLGRYPVTNAQYAAFVKTSGQSGPTHWGKDGTISMGFENHPVVFVSWEDAVTFCAWLSRESGQQIGLPTEAQWEKAARGTDGRTYPWGNQEPDPTRCNFFMQVNTTTLVGQYSPQGDSPYGCADMAGNVWEWCADWYDESYYGKSPQSNPAGPGTGQYRVLRGGSWSDIYRLVRSAFRDRYLPNYRHAIPRGFRCALSIP